MDRLPVIMVDGRIVSTGMYPSRQQLAQELGIAAAPEELSTRQRSGMLLQALAHMKPDMH